MKIPAPTLEKHQMEFVDFLVRSEALLFGEFKLKSGRMAPYFINMGRFDNGEKVSKLGGFYAAHLVKNLGQDFDLVFGPAYKGIPLAVSTCTALFLNHKRSVNFSFDRKEIKDHGDKGKIVGSEIKSSSRVVIVEDVITAGTTLKEVVPYLRDSLGASIKAVVIAVDRCEKGDSSRSAKQDVEEGLAVKVLPIVNIYQVLSYLSAENTSGMVLSDEFRNRAETYLKEFGA